MANSKEFRPDGWDELKAELMAEIKKRAGNDKDAEAVAENIFEMGGSAMLRCTRQKCGAPALCAKGLVAVLTPAASQLTVPGRQGVSPTIRVPITYKKAEGWTGRGVVAFIPDDETVIVRPGGNHGKE